MRSVYAYSGGFGQKSPEVKIDLVNNKVFLFRAKQYEERKIRLKNQGYQKIFIQPQEAVDQFIQVLNSYDVHHWDDKYMNLAVEDGRQWGIEISYTDGTKKEIFGSNAYPQAYQSVAKALKEFVGEEILYYQLIDY